MGDSITEGTISAWQKNVGDAIKVDDVVVVIETDKVRHVGMSLYIMRIGLLSFCVSMMIMLMMTHTHG